MIADIMREISNDATEKDQTVQKALEMLLKEIEDDAKRGKRKIVFHVPYEAFKNTEEYDRRYRDVKNMLEHELKKEGFRLARGSEIGEGMGNWNTPYVVW